MGGLAHAASWYPYKAEVTTPPFAADGKVSMVDYVPLTKASKKWKICVSFPHMKDAYWLGVDYGVVDEAKRLGVSAQIVEAGGYTNLAKQISQIEDCVSRGANAVTPRPTWGGPTGTPTSTTIPTAPTMQGAWTFSKWPQLGTNTSTT